MKVLTSQEAKQIDRETVQKGIMEETLIEQAAASVADIVETYKPHAILSVVGKGNNGADGVATARILKNRGYKVEILLVGDMEQSSEGFKKQFKITNNYRVKVYRFGQDNLDFEEYDLIIDGLLGIGLKGEVKAEVSKVIDKINSSNKVIISIDIPSGLSCDTGEIMGNAIKASETVTFGNLKIGHLLYPAREFCGDIKIANLSFDSSILDSINRNLVTSDMVKSLLPDRPEDSYKYKFGSVLILAGSAKYPGAPILTALGAQRVGTGIVKLITPADSSSVLALEPSIIYRSLDKEYFESGDVEIIREDIKKADVLVIGPGITEQATGFILRLVNDYKEDKLFLLDADALLILKDRKIKLNKNFVITPHVGELTKVYRNVKNDVLGLESYSKEIGSTIVLKSSTTIITDGEETYFNIAGNSSLAKGGSGDLLSGVIGGYIAQGLSSLKASIIGTYVVYDTAQNLSKDYTEYFVTPKLICDNIYKTISKLTK